MRTHGYCAGCNYSGFVSWDGSENYIICPRCGDEIACAEEITYFSKRGTSQNYLKRHEMDSYLPKSFHYDG